MRALVFTAFALLLCRGAYSEATTCGEKASAAASELPGLSTFDSCNTESGKKKCWQVAYKVGDTLKYDVGCGIECVNPSSGSAVILGCKVCDSINCNKAVIAKLDCATSTSGLTAPNAGTTTSTNCDGGFCYQELYKKTADGKLYYTIGCTTAADTCPTNNDGTKVHCKTCTDKKDCNKEAAAIAQLKCVNQNNLDSPNAALAANSANCDKLKCFQQLYTDGNGALKYNLGCASSHDATSCGSAPSGSEVACAFCNDASDCNKASVLASTTAAAAGGATTTAAGGGSSNTSTTPAGGATTTAAASVLASPALLLLASLMMLLIR